MDIVSARRNTEYLDVEQKCESKPAHEASASVNKVATHVVDADGCQRREQYL